KIMRPAQAGRLIYHRPRSGRSTLSQFRPSLLVGLRSKTSLTILYRYNRDKWARAFRVSVVERDLRGALPITNAFASCRTPNLPSSSERPIHLIAVPPVITRRFEIEDFANHVLPPRPTHFPLHPCHPRNLSRRSLAQADPRLDFFISEQASFLTPPDC